MEFKFKELRVYQESITFSLFIYEITKKWPGQYRYNITDQLLRASLSIPLNIAEGSSRTSKDFQHFLSISRGSCYECVALIDIAFQLHIITPKENTSLKETLEYIAKMLTKLKNSI